MPMLPQILCLILTFAADDPWDKVRAAKKTGVEMRIYKKDAQPPPIQAKFDEATADSLIVVVKDAQVAIPKDEIERIDYRPPPTNSRVTRETKTTKGVYHSAADSQGQPMAKGKTAPPAAATSSSSRAVSIAGKPGFELLYRAKGASK